MNSKEAKSDAIRRGYLGMLPTLNIVYTQIKLGEAKFHRHLEALTH